MCNAPKIVTLLQYADLQHADLQHSLHCHWCSPLLQPRVPIA